MFLKKIIKIFIPNEVLLFRLKIINNLNTKRTKDYLKKYLAGHEIAKLQLGTSRNNLDGWFNTDLFPNERRSVHYLDVIYPFPIDDSAFDYIFCEELIEHIDYRDAINMLKECFRILKPGGKIRIGTPDLESFIQLYKKENTDLEKDFIKWTIDKYLPDIGKYKDVFVINNLFKNWGHKFIYDFDTLKESLLETGFSNIMRYKEGESDDINFKGIDRHGDSSNNKKFRDLESFFLESTRP